MCGDCKDCGKHDFQVHITVLAKSLSAFESFCKQLKIEPLVIVDYNGDAQSVSTFTAASHPTLLQSLASMLAHVQLLGEQFVVIRKKVEKSPFSKRHPVQGDATLDDANGKYWETHFTCDAQQVAGRDLRYIGLHSSRRADNYDKVFLTLRDHLRGVTKNMHLNHGEYIKMRLKEIGIVPLKQRSELCIVDDNLALDRWTD